MKKCLLILAAVIIALCLALVGAQTGANIEAEKEAIVKAALDYGDGFYSAAPERMERAIHPDLNKVVVLVPPKIGKTILGYSTFSGLIEMTRAKIGYLDPAARKIQAFALEVDDNVACAKVTSAQFNDFLQLVKFDGQWKIVNVLWTFGPDSPGRLPLTGFDPEKEKPAIQAAAMDYVEGTLAGDAARVERALHLEACRAVVNVVPGTGKTALSRSRYSSLVEPVRAKLNAQPPEKRQVDVRVVDIMDGMAFVRADSAFSSNYIQMNLVDGQWKIINILSRPRASAPPR